jgi:AraC-like DNA-binding protein
MNQNDDDIYQIDTKKALSEHLFIKRENEFHHASFEREMTFYESVRSGNVETVKTLYTPLGGEGFGKLSNDPLQNLKYHLVVTIAMITRFCINSGMTPEEAYSMSDVYIQRTDICRSDKEINDIHYQAVIEFTKRMRQIQNGHIYSKTVSLILDYISDHLHERIYLKDVANAVSCTVPYISRLFHSEMGTPISSYIMQKKIEAAANMLLFSDYSSLEISNYLNFSSQSYFIKQFKKQMGVTPKEYRRRFYTVGWMNSKHENQG